MSENNLQSQLEEVYNDLQSSLNGSASEAYNQRRITAIDSFNKLGFPTTKHEEWKYSNVKNLVKGTYNFKAVKSLKSEDVKNLEIPGLKGVILYFVNGYFQEELSDLSLAEGKISVQTFQEAQANNPEILNEHFSKYSKDSIEAFTALNTALASNGVVVNVEANATIEHPIILRMITDVTQENVGSNIRNLVVVGKNAEVKIAEVYRTLGEQSSFVNTVTEIVVAESARVDYYKIQDDNDASYHVGTTNVYQEDKSYFYAATITLNGGFTRNNLNLDLNGEYLESFMYGLYIPNEKQHVDNHTVADHRKPNSVSNELYKGVLMDKSTGVFNGKIFVRQEAQKTNAYQNCRNVITSDSATMNTKPQLEIWADDVKCSHGATTGMLNDEAIFYMQSRGIPKEEAIKMQLLAFADDVVSQIKIETIREYLSEIIHKKLG
ncbi:Fe-S cluster assembly protein SufD [Arcticibacterium luteifluviistationis]|uniref:Fe-S cluster assembly protein SufD n=1 Tax=Arcticibacterium luteifluviistationis TaxID=1784714 RepID=A0A2Z4G6T8_9BACT|nr:Fe-S cluster assembly protein SufD [Arcticibacterium luteifluviistationis]AWV96830.1 Fe-S cluster assembly protein SufD [Arcticibacterium luteifluviistationis]